MRFPKVRRRAVLVSAATMVSAGLLATGLTVPAALATNVSDAQTEVDRIGHDVEVAAEQYNTAQAQIDTLQQQLEVARTRSAEQQRYIDSLQQSLGSVAAQAYKGGGVDPSLVVLTGNPLAYFENTNLVNQIARSQGATLDQWETAKAQLDSDQAGIEAKLTEIQTLEAQLAETKADVEAKLAKAEVALAKAQSDAAARAAAAQAASRSRTAAGNTTTAAPATGPPVNVDCSQLAVAAPNARAAGAIAFACAQLGKPYRWAGAGPNSFDCSGLTMAAYASVGVSLPHSSSLQYSQNPKVAKADLQPGDLVFFYSGLSHMGLYIGNGQMIHAPRTGDVVKISSIEGRQYVGASRP